MGAIFEWSIRAESRQGLSTALHTGENTFTGRPRLREKSAKNSPSLPGHRRSAPSGWKGELERTLLFITFSGMTTGVTGTASCHVCPTWSDRLMLGLVVPHFTLLLSRLSSASQGHRLSFAAYHPRRPAYIHGTIFIVPGGRHTSPHTG